MKLDLPGTEQTTQWIPYTLAWDDAPLDLAFLYENEKPAGKHGFLTVKGDKFVFENGQEAKFWGTLFNSSANFPTHDYSEKVARRLAKFGVNMVRTHQMDAEWAAPNIFQCTRGRLRDNSLSFDPESMDRLDYLIHCLKKEGIYIYLDLLSHRSFKSGDGVDNAAELPESGKPYSNFDRRLIELQKKFNRDLLTHVNPYTGLAYKDDPAIVLMEFANENDLFFFTRNLEPYRTRLEIIYREWAASKTITVPADQVDFNTLTEPILQFLHHLQKKYYEEMTADLRQLGVKVPLTGSNWSLGTLHQASAAGDLDFADSHAYWDMWSDRYGNNRPLIGERCDYMLKDLSHRRLLDKPFFVSEWDVTWPNEWRATNPMSMAAAASFQGWNGLSIHTYRYRATTPVDGMGGVLLNGVGYRLNFDTFNDPAKFGLFYHAALMFRRGDIEVGKKSVAIQVTPEKIDSLPKSDGPICRLSSAQYQVPALELLTEQHRCGLLLPGHTAQADTVISTEALPEEPSDGMIKSDNGQVFRNWKKKLCGIDTPCTKSVYGFVGENEPVQLDGLKVTAQTPFAVVAISSLTDEPIRSSRNLLLTTVGRADNSGARYNEAHTERLDIGHGPVLIEVIHVKIELTTTQSTLQVLSIDPERLVTGIVPAKHENGKLTFETGKLYPSMYYLIQIT